MTSSKGAHCAGQGEFTTGGQYFFFLLEWKEKEADSWIFLIKEPNSALSFDSE